MACSPITVLKYVYSYNYSARLQSKIKEEEDFENCKQIKRKRKADEVRELIANFFERPRGHERLISLFIHFDV